MNSIEILRKDYCKHVLHHFRTSDITTFQRKCVEQCSDDKDRKIAIEVALRDALMKLLCANATNNSQIKESYISFCIELCRKNLACAMMPVLLLSDMFDTMTLDHCEELFEYVENNVSIWKEDLFFKPCKNSLLRMCNDLLRRLSRSQQTVFCGRILLFLAKFFPFSERSGLNIASDFNLANKTEFGAKRSEGDVAESMDVDVEKIETKISIDHGLYGKFWTLQDFFRNPNQCYVEANWKKFLSDASDVLLAFSCFKLDDHKGVKETHYFAKYLTNAKLFELQLSDSNFRKCILLQFLILFQYLNSHVKFKPTFDTEDFEQIEWVKTATAQVYSLLIETPPDGAAFAESVKRILQREECWNKWKNENCPAFAKPLPEPSRAEDEARPPIKKKRLLGDIIAESLAKGKYYLGNPELTKLWNLYPSNLEACTSKDRDFLPSLEEYFKEAIEQLNPAAGIEEQYKKYNDGNFGWRALRLLAERSPHFFIPGNYSITSLSEYVEIMIKKTARDQLLHAPINVKPEAGVVLPSASTGQNIKEEILKQDHDYSRPMSKPIIRISNELLNELAEVSKHRWEELATKLGYRNDEILFFAKKPTPFERCREMLLIWAEEDPDASIKNLMPIVRSLFSDPAATTVKTNNS